MADSRTETAEWVVVATDIRTGKRRILSGCRSEEEASDEEVAAVVEKHGGLLKAGALTKAARELGYSKPTIIRRMDAIGRTAKEQKQ